tara:strand:+ start:1460 stop:2026 length:567 start_codon:yes stop_codon:yes gene_type:complete
MLQRLSIPDVWVYSPKIFPDNRGFFSEVYNKRTLQQVGIDLTFVQDNQSFNHEKNIIRGLHFQRPPFAQEKLVRVSAGSIIDVAVDIRRGSPHYGKYVTQILSSKNGQQLFIPEGFLHGFVTLEENTEVLYKCTEHYSPEHEVTVIFDDPDLDVDWKTDTRQCLVSDKDKQGVSFCGLQTPFSFGHGS